MNSKYQQPSTDLLALSKKSVEELAQLDMELSWANPSSVRVIDSGFILDVETGKPPVLYIRPTNFKVGEEVHDFWIEYDLVNHDFVWDDDDSNLIP